MIPMRYAEYQPPKDLADCIRCLWVFENPSRFAVADTIVADGYPELILNWGRPCSERSQAGKLVRQSWAVVAGQLTRPLVLQSASGAGMIGVRFHPFGLSRMTRVPIRDFRDQRLDAYEVFPNLEKWRGRLAQAQTDFQRCQVCMGLLREAVLQPVDSTVARAVSLIDRHHGNARVRQIREELGVSDRKLPVDLSNARWRVG